MRKQVILALIAVSSTLISFSQSPTLKGTVTDTVEKKNPVNAVISVLRQKDSVLVRFARAAKDGSFSIPGLKEDKYIMMITHPYMGDYFDVVEVKAPETNLGHVYMTPKSKLLAEVLIKTGAPIRIKGDTTIYTADSFKVRPGANVEELLRKLPGIQVDKDGKITAMGERVQKVLVDGEEFFGDDPGMAVKNLRADAVKEVQVFDKKSDQAEFTGIDDGQKQKTINLKLKDDSRKGYFGKIDAAYGPQKNIDDRYNSNLMFNAFKGKRKISAFSLNGNTGQDGLGWQDSEKYGGENDDVSMSMDEDGGMMWMWRGGSSDEEPYINTENGYIVNNNAGLHFSNKWDDKRTLAISPKFNRQQYNNVVSTFSQRAIGDTILNDFGTKVQDVNRQNFKNSLTYDMKLDSANSIKFTLKANFYRTENIEDLYSESVSNTQTIKNTVSNFLQQETEKQSVLATVMYRHKFKKPRRTLSFNADWYRLKTDGNNFLRSDNDYYQNGIVDSSVNKDQMFDIDKLTKRLTTKLTYTEPLSKTLSLELGYELTHSTGYNDRTTYNFSSSSGKYDDKVDTLSNNFDQKIVVNKPNARISYNLKKIKFNFGSGFGFTKFDFFDVTELKEYNRNFTNIFPSASFNYSYKPNHNINFNYNGNTQQPTLNQLQPLRNNDDNNNKYIGNPDLKQSFTHAFNISHNAYNFIKDIWMYQSFNIRTTSNSITNSYTYNTADGTSITQPVNTDGNFSMGFWGGLGMKIKKANINLNFNPNFNYSRFADIINNNTSFSKTLSSGLSIWMNKTKDKKYDFSLSNSFNYNRNKTSQNNNVNSFYTNHVNLNATVYYKKTWSVSSEYSFYARQKTEQFQDNLTNHIWSGRLQKTFKNNEFTAYVLVRDILKQNIGIDRSYYGNTTSETINQRLQRYFMIGFTWDFKNKGSKPAETKTP